MYICAYMEDTNEKMKEEAILKGEERERYCVDLPDHKHYTNC